MQTYHCKFVVKMVFYQWISVVMLASQPSVECSFKCGITLPRDFMAIEECKQVFFLPYPC